MIIDLHYLCAQLKEKEVAARVQELINQIPGVHLTAVGGFPILTTGTNFRWCGEIVKFGTFRSHVSQALGLSAVLTYTNKSNKSLEELAQICRNRNHLWGYHWINATLVFAGFPSIVELSFNRDRRFYSSWPVGGEGVFTLTAGLKEWHEYTNHADDNSFDAETRKAMREARKVLDDWL
jgi:hypothetical protein